MKLRHLATVLALTLSFPLAHADTPTVAETVAASVRANPGQAADLVAQAIAANPDQAAAIVRAAVLVAPNSVKAITLAAIKAVGSSSSGQSLQALSAIVQAAASAIPSPSFKVQIRAALGEAQAANIIPNNFVGRLVSVVQSTSYTPPANQNSGGNTGEAAGEAPVRQTQTQNANPIIIQEARPIYVGSPT